MATILLWHVPYSSFYSGIYHSADSNEFPRMPQWRLRYPLDVAVFLSRMIRAPAQPSKTVFRVSSLVVSASPITISDVKRTTGGNARRQRQQPEHPVWFASSALITLHTSYQSVTSEWRMRLSNHNADVFVGLCPNVFIVCRSFVLVLTFIRFLLHVFDAKRVICGPQ